MLLRAAQRLRPSARGLISAARLCTSSGDRSESSDRFHSKDILDAEAWKTPPISQELGDPTLKGLRFPVGTPVRCYVGDDSWLGGTVVAQNYREPEWPEERPSAPYQVLLNDEHLENSDRPNAIFAPADLDEVIQFNLRFPLGATAECRAVGTVKMAALAAHAALHRSGSRPAQGGPLSSGEPSPLGPRRAAAAAPRGLNIAALAYLPLISR